MPTKRIVKACMDESTYQYIVARTQQLRISMSSYLNALVGADRGDPHYRIMLQASGPLPDSARQELVLLGQRDTDHISLISDEEKAALGNPTVEESRILTTKPPTISMSELLKQASEPSPSEDALDKEFEEEY